MRTLSLQLAVLSIILLLAGCGGGGGGGVSAGPASWSGGEVLAGDAKGGNKPSQSPTATTTSTPTPMPTATSTPTPEPTSTLTPEPTPTPAPTTSTGNPFTGARMYVDPNSYAAQQAAAWRATRPADAAQLDKIASQPQAKWMSGGDTVLPSGDVSWLHARFSEGNVPVVVIYRIPKRDLGGLAAGGATNAEAYKSWIRSFASAVGNNKGIVILEPDALGQIANMTAADQAARYELMRYAVTTLKAQPNLHVYIDGGNPYWVRYDQMADRLRQADVAKADGFALNVSNFAWTNDSLNYGKAISDLIGGKHFVVDTSRNGLGPTADYQWCNPPGRALGPKYTASTGYPLADAYMFIKPPGMSDGACNGGPSWGFWADYALGLCQRAAY